MKLAAEFLLRTYLHFPFIVYNLRANELIKVKGRQERKKSKRL